MITVKRIMYELLYRTRGGENIVIKPTMRCNLACSYCGSEMPGSACWVMPVPEEEELCAADWKELFRTDIIPRHDNIRQVGFSGGEPFLYKQIGELVNWLTSQRIPVFIYSNLMLRRGLNDIKKSFYVKIRATFHADAMRLHGERSVKVFRANLADYQEKFNVYSQELKFTGGGYNPTIEDSRHRRLNRAEDLNQLYAHEYSPDGTFYQRDDIPNPDKYAKWRKECEGMVANPYREKLLNVRK